MLSFSETNLLQGIEAIRSILGLKEDSRLQLEFEAGLHPDLLSYEKVQGCNTKLPAIEKYLIGAKSMLNQFANYFDAIHVWRCACMVQYIHAALDVLTASQIPGLEVRLSRLAAETTFDGLDATAFELITAAQYALHPGVTHVEFIPETAKGKTPDFLVRFSGIDSSVECKKIDRAQNYSILVRNTARDRIRPVLDVFREVGVSAVAEIAFNRNPAEINPRQLVEASKDALRWQTPIIESGFTFRLTRLPRYKNVPDMHFPSHRFLWHRYGFRIRSEWFGIVHHLNGPFAHRRDLPKDLQGGRSSLIGEIEWDSAVKWRISAEEVVRKYRQFTFERAFDGLNQVRDHGVNSTVHLWLETDYFIQGRKDAYQDLFNRLRTSQRDVFGWLILNETMFEASPKGRYALTENAHVIRGPAAIGLQPLVSGVFAPGSASVIGEFGSMEEMADLDDEIV